MEKRKMTKLEREGDMREHCDVKCPCCENIGMWTHIEDMWLICECGGALGL